MCLDIEEESWALSENWGEQPQIPQWEAITDEVILDTSEVSSVRFGESHVPTDSLP